MKNRPTLLSKDPSCQVGNYFKKRNINSCYDLDSYVDLEIIERMQNFLHRGNSIVARREIIEEWSWDPKSWRDSIQPHV